MDRALQYISGGVASTALIAGAIAAFISITALVGDTNFPNGSLVQPPGGPHSVRIAEPSQPPAEPIAVAAPPTLTALSPGAVHQLAWSAARSAGARTERLRYRRPPRGRALAECRERSRGYAAWLTGRGRRHPLESSRRERIAAVRGNRSISPAVSGARAGRHSPALVRRRHAGEHAAVRGTGPPSTPPGLATKPGGTLPASPRSRGPPGLASKPGGLGVARSPAGFRPARRKRAEPSHFRPSPASFSRSCAARRRL